MGVLDESDGEREGHCEPSGPLAAAVDDAAEPGVRRHGPGRAAECNGNAQREPINRVNRFDFANFRSAARANPERRRQVADDRRPLEHPPRHSAEHSPRGQLPEGLGGDGGSDEERRILSNDR